MRRARKSKARFEVSLFPFLAVLICTVGVLIVLLMITVKSADVRAKTEQEVVEKTQEEEQQQLDEAQIQLDDQLIRVEGLKSVRPDLLERLQDIRSHRGYLTDELNKFEEQIARAQSQLEALTTKAEQHETSDTESEIARLRQSIESEIEARSVARAAYVENPPTLYSILPHKGPNGTTRRPIFIECTAEKMVIQPHEIELKPEDFAPPLEANNPLDAALIAVREYWNEYQLAGEQGEPYPLLVVRPSGARTYVMARRAMKSWDDEFGYELVTDDKRLEFGPRDSQLEDEINEAIEKARKRKRHAIATRVLNRGNQLANGSTSGRNRRGFRASGSKGGFVDQDGSAAEYKSQFEGQGSDSSPFDSASNWKNNFDSNSTASERNQQNQGNVAQQPSTANSNSQARANSGGQPTALNVTSSETSLANQRGGNWALPNHTPGTTGYHRPITVYCDRDHLNIRSIDGSWQTIPITGATRDVVTPLVESVWQRIDSWGTAGNGGYWKPELRFKVMPDGQQRAADLATLLNGSGLSIRIDALPNQLKGQ